LWAVRLLGYLPPLEECIDCGEALGDQAAYFHAMRDGLWCERHRHIASSELTRESRAVAATMMRVPVEKIAAEPVPASRLADLRKFLMQSLMRHLERTLETAAALERLP
jgi:recombinational DNA repair protein (RecF pathway)